MKKVCLIIMCLLLVMPMLTACKQVSKTKDDLIKYHSKLEQYTNSSALTTTKKAGNVIDLSDGRQMRYDMRFAPNDPNFDVKLKDPYNY